MASGRNEWLKSIAAIAAVIHLAGCGDQEANGQVDDQNLQSHTILAAPQDPLSKQVEAFTKNHTRMVWMRYTKTDTNDVFANYEQFVLCGLDTRDGLGERVLIEDKSNYARPMISPDGSTIVFSDKNTDRKGSTKHFDPKVYKTDWVGTPPEELGDGYAVDIWRDPKTGHDWVYVADLKPTDRSSMFGSKLERFRLDKPSERELVWNKTEISVDNIQLSRDGLRASCLFPWPTVGVINFENNTWHMNQNGCWPSMAPDNSYVAWVFDGSHKSIHLFSDDKTRRWEVDVSHAPGNNGHEVYHPRWSNHPRYFVMTGPYIGETIGKGGNEAEVYIGNFSENMEKIVAWSQVTDNGLGDFYPDLWVKGGDKAGVVKTSTPPASQPDKPAPGMTEAPKATWPAKPDNLIFLWDNAGEKNEVVAPDGSSAICKVEARDGARFSRSVGMLTDGGYFEADEASAQRAMELRGLEMLIRPAESPQTGVIFSDGGLRLWQNGEFLFFRGTGSADAYQIGHVEVGKPVHVAITEESGKWFGYLDGKKNSSQAKADSPAIRKGLTFGGGWAGEIEAVAFYGRPLEVSEIQDNAAFQLAKASRKSIPPRYKLTGRLVEKTPTPSIESLDTYNRALVAYSYDVVKVEDGELKDERIRVYHWVILDRKVLQTDERAIGRLYEIEVEPFKEHPELDPERKFNDSEDFLIRDFYDVATPEDPKP